MQPNQDYRLLACNLSKSVCRVKVNVKLDQPFGIKSRVRQDKSLSPLLITIYSQVMMNRAEVNQSGKKMSRVCLC